MCRQTRDDKTHVFIHVPCSTQAVFEDSSINAGGEMVCQKRAVRKLVGIATAQYPELPGDGPGLGRGIEVEE